MADGTKHVANVDGRDIRRWEVETRKSFLSEDFSYSALTDLARLALKRTGALVMSKADFDDACVSVTEGAGSESQDPTQTAPTEEPSSALPSEPESASGSGKKLAKQR